MARKGAGEIELLTEELRSLVKSGDILNYTELDLEKKLNTTRKTIRKHLKEIKQEVGHRDIKIISIRFIDIMETTVSDIEKLWKKAKRDKDDRQILYYTKQMWIALEKFTDFVERYGIKEKVADKHEINSKSVIINLDLEAESAKILQEIRG